MVTCKINIPLSKLKSLMGSLKDILLRWLPDTDYIRIMVHTHYTEMFLWVAKFIIPLCWRSWVHSRSLKDLHPYSSCMQQPNICTHGNGPRSMILDCFNSQYSPSSALDYFWCSKTFDQICSHSIPFQARDPVHIMGIYSQSHLYIQVNVFHRKYVLQLYSCGK